MTGRAAVALLSWLALLAALVVAVPTASGVTGPCVSLGGGLGAPWTGRVGPGDRACARLTYPRGSEVVAVARVGHGHGVDLTYVDADGVVQCRRRADDFPATRSCVLSGRAPYRVVATSQRRTPFALVVARLDHNAGCTGLTRGSWGTDQGTTVRFARGAFAACLTVPSADWGRRELTAFERRRGTGRATVVVRGLAGGACVVGARAARQLNLCRGRSLPGEPVTVLLATTGDASTWRVVRRNVEDTTGCVTTGSTVFGAPGTAGSLRHFSELDCYTVTANPEDQLAIGVHDGRGEATVRVFGQGGSSVCREYAGSLCAAYGRDTYQVIVHARGGADPAGDYAVEPWLLRPADGPVAACQPSTAPVERVSGNLDDQLTAVCLRAPRSLQYDVEVTQGAMPLAAQSVPGPTSFPLCQVLGGTRLECSDYGSTPRADRLLVLGRPDGVSALGFAARGEITAP